MRVKVVQYVELSRDEHKSVALDYLKQLTQN